MHRLAIKIFGLILLSTMAARAVAVEGESPRAMWPSESNESPVRLPAQETTISRLPSIFDTSVRPVQYDVPMNTLFDPTTDVPLIEPDHCWAWQVVPEGLMYRSYLAGNREPRMAIQLFRESSWGWLWDAALGGRIGLIRYGTQDPLWAEGWQFDADAAAFPRLTADYDGDLVSCDYRYGFDLTHRQGRFEAKLAYYHLSSHLGDEYMLKHPEVHRINYSRNVIVLGAAVYPLNNVRTYAEAGYATYTDGGTEPWEFQFGVEYSPLEPSGLRGAPFFAVNGYLRQEVNYGGNVTIQTGWQWRGLSGRLARIGLHYLNGQSDQYEFFRQHEQQLGVGFWYDF